MRKTIGRYGGRNICVARGISFIIANVAILLLSILWDFDFVENIKKFFFSIIGFF